MVPDSAAAGFDALSCGGCSCCCCPQQAGFAASAKRAGSARNLPRQPAPQKYQLRPACSARCGVLSGSTVMPQTGSRTGVLSADSIASINGTAPALAMSPYKELLAIYHRGV